MAVMWSSDHSVIYRSLHLCLAIANDLSLVIGFTRVDRKVVLMQLGYQFNYYNLMHNQESQTRYNYHKQDIIIRKVQAWWLDAPGFALLLLGVSVLDLC
jgi:hypothetical protein